ncbi:hypothetical protein EV361DRAFT_306092 [Lentinula raphanica]|nr:hypothetical protein EV361DRAFT_306092 [Lentinula raphanica]
MLSISLLRSAENRVLIHRFGRIVAIEQAIAKETAKKTSSTVPGPSSSSSSSSPSEPFHWAGSDRQLSTKRQGKNSASTSHRRKSKPPEDSGLHAETPVASTSKQVEAGSRSTRKKRKFVDSDDEADRHPVVAAKKVKASKQSLPSSTTVDGRRDSGETKKQTRTDNGKGKGKAREPEVWIISSDSEDSAREDSVQPLDDDHPSAWETPAASRANRGQGNTQGPGEIRCDSPELRPSAAFESVSTSNDTTLPSSSSALRVDESPPPPPHPPPPPLNLPSSPVRIPVPSPSPQTSPSLPKISDWQSTTPNLDTPSVSPRPAVSVVSITTTPPPIIIVVDSQELESSDPGDQMEAEEIAAVLEDERDFDRESSIEPSAKVDFNTDNKVNSNECSLESVEASVLDGDSQNSSMVTEEEAQTPHQTEPRGPEPGAELTLEAVFEQLLQADVVSSHSENNPRDSNKTRGRSKKHDQKQPSKTDTILSDAGTKSKPKPSANNGPLRTNKAVKGSPAATRRDSPPAPPPDSSNQGNIQNSVQPTNLKRKRYIYGSSDEEGEVLVRDTSKGLTKKKRLNAGKTRSSN